MSRQILEQVCAELIECAAVTNSSEFCKNWLAKDESYLRVLKFHKIDASADAVAVLVSYAPVSNTDATWQPAENEGRKVPCELSFNFGSAASR